MLAALAKTGNVSAAARTAKVARSRHYVWIDEDVNYRTASREAMEQAADLLEQEARRRAETGVLEPVFYKGEKVGLVRKYSDTLLIFLLKGAKPEKYRERHEVSGPGGGPIKTEDVTPSDERLGRVLALLDRARERRAASGTDGA